MRKVENFNYNTTITISISSIDDTTYALLDQVLSNKNFKTVFKTVDGALVINAVIADSVPLLRSTIVSKS